MAYLISFELINPENNYHHLHKTINKLTTFWIKPLPSMYLVNSKLSEVMLYEKLISKLAKDDRLFIIEVTSWPAAYLDRNIAAELNNFFSK